MITKVAQLTCDVCGHAELCAESDVVLARIKAQSNNWKFMSYQGLMIKGRNRARQIDACPKCSLPTPDALAAKMAEEG